MTASTAITKAKLVTLTSGQVVAVTAGTAAVDILGVLDKTIASTDTDYATAGRPVPVWVPLERCTLFEADVTSGLTASDVGLEVDLTDAGTINRGANSVKVVKIVQYISATKALCWVKFNGAY